MEDSKNDCPHVLPLNLKDLKHFQSFTSKYLFYYIVIKSCCKCEKKPRTCMCIDCGKVGCNEHVKEHCLSEKHFIIMNLVEQIFWCFECNKSITDTNLEKIKELEDSKLIDAIQKLNISKEEETEPESHTEDKKDDGEEDNSIEEDKQTITLQEIVDGIIEKKFKNIVVLTGAGISVNAGIPDFRTPGTGLYSKLASFNLPYPELVFSFDYFKKKPEVFYQLAQEMFAAKYLPTKTHYFIRLLQDKGILVRNYTQNIDSLEIEAGLNPELLVQAHGSTRTAHCLDCDAEVSNEIIMEALKSGKPKYCDKCGGICKPDVVFYGEGLPDRFFDSKEELKTNCDLLIIMGTSLVVAPFSTLILLPPEEVPKVSFNIEVPEAFKRSTTLLHLHVEGDCDISVEKLVKMLKWDKEFEELMKEREEYAKKHKIKEPIPKL